MNAKYFLLIFISLIMTFSIYCMEKQHWYTPYVQSRWQPTEQQTLLSRTYQAANFKPKHSSQTSQNWLLSPNIQSQLTHNILNKLHGKQFVNRIAERDRKEFEKVAERYAPPEDIKKTIEKGFLPNAPSDTPYLIKGSFHIPYLAKGSPPIYHKGGNLERLAFRERMQKIAKEEGLDDLIVFPQKYFYKTSKGWRVFAEPIIPAEKQTPLTLEETKKLAKLMKKSQYWDLHSEKGATNWIRTKDGKIALIDTEGASFMSPYDFYNKKNVFKERFTKNTMTSEAQQWAQKKYEKEEKKLEASPTTEEYLAKKEKKSIPYAQKYDPEGINFQGALRAYKKVRHLEKDW